LKYPLLWLVWCLLVFGAFNIHAAPNPDLLGDLPQGRNGPTGRPPGLNNIMAALLDEGDARRYFAYAEAILAHPYDGNYVIRDVSELKQSYRPHVVVRPDRPLWPWRDFVVEYPPGMLVAALVPALFTSYFPTYQLLFALFMGAALTTCVWFNVRTSERIASGAGRETLVVSILFVLALGIVCVRRYDALVALAISAAISGIVTRRPAGSGFALGLGTIVKGTPLLLAPIGAIHWLRSGRYRELTIAASVCSATVAIGAALYASVAGGHALDALNYHADRPLQVESPYGAALMLIDIFHHGFASKVSSYGSENVQSLWEPRLRRLSSPVLLIAIASVLAWYWRASERAGDEIRQIRALLAGATAILIAFIGLGKVFSPQYLVWLLPSGVMAAVISTERSRVLLVGAALMTQVEYPFVYSMNSPWTIQIIAAIALIRDGLMLSAAVSLIKDASCAPPGDQGSTAQAPTLSNIRTEHQVEAGARI
jgi:hypothetical protein